jgi:hypothetical protein
MKTKRLVVITLLAMFLAACASGESSRGAYGSSRGATWDCHQLQSDPWAVGKTPCDR